MEKQLSEYIKQQLKQKQKPKEIVSSLMKNGYDEKEAKHKVHFIIILKYLKLLGIILFSIVILSFLFIWLYFTLTEKTIPVKEMYPSKPESWIVKTENNQSLVDVSSITKGNSYFEGLKQVYTIPFTDLTTIFEVNGYYKGTYFYDSYNKGNKDLMRITSSMNPSDGVIEGFIVERINDYKINNVTAFIFVDSDWKNAMPNTKIFYGSKYQYTSDFKFNEISPGIYMTQIYDDPNRHFENFSISYGGIAVGDLTKEDILNNNIINKTFIRLYS